MLKIEVHELNDVVFCHYRPDDAGVNNGGYLGRVYPGGRFKNIHYDDLLVLGTGQHKVVVNEKVSTIRGNQPDEDFSGHAWAMFCYEVGAITDHELKNLLQEDRMKMVEKLKLEVLARNPRGLMVPIPEATQPATKITLRKKTDETPGRTE